MGNNATINHFFPLHRDVLLAAVRELLIIDGTVDGKSLEVVGQISEIASDRTSVKNGKRKRVSKEDPMSDDDVTECVSPFNEWNEPHGKLSAENQVVAEEDHAHRAMYNLPTAEAVCELIVTRSLSGLEKRFITSKTSPRCNAPGIPTPCTRLRDQTSEDPVNKTLCEELITFDEPDVENRLHLHAQGHPPRKVSDVDESMLTSNIMAYSKEHKNADTSSSMMLHKIEEFKGGSCFMEKTDDLARLLAMIAEDPSAFLCLAPNDIPELLEVSIFAEESLRQVAYKIASELVKTFNDKSLREFLGYKSSAMKRNKLEDILSEFLFDVSHAMFAWEETEEDVIHDIALSSDFPRRLMTSLKSRKKVESKVRDILFDSKELQKIGGFDCYSLLPHALSVRRLRQRGISWKEFASTKEGRKMFRHLCSGTAIDAGERRRILRKRQRKPVWVNSKRAADSVSPSNTPQNDCDVSEGETTSSLQLIHPVPDLNVLGQDIVVKPMASVPGEMQVTLQKVDSKNWGILLAKEGGMCVVVRAPENPENRYRVESEYSDQAEIRSGDIVLSVRNDEYERQSPGSYGSRCESPLQSTDNKMGNAENTDDRFREIVKMFKSSRILHLKLMRVQH